MTPKEQFLAALLRTRIPHLQDTLEKAVETYATEQTDKEANSRDPEGPPRWPGYKKLFDSGEEVEILDQVMLKASPALKQLYEQAVEDDLYADTNVSRILTTRILPEPQAEKIFNDTAQDRWSDIVDGEEYSRDPYRYHGVSRRDFLAANLRSKIIRLAHNYPKLRQHLVPILRQTR